MPRTFNSNNSIDVDEMIRLARANSPVIDPEEFGRKQEQEAKLAKARAEAEQPVIVEEPAPAPKPAEVRPVPLPDYKPEINAATTQPTPVSGLIIEEEPVETAPEEEYTGRGIVMTKEAYDHMTGNDKSNGVKVTAMNDDRMDDVKQYMAEQDAEIERLKKKKEEMEAKGVAPSVQTPQNIVNIYIDKARVGDIALTPDQQRKVEMAQKIVITETTEMNFKSLKIRRSDVDPGADRKRKDTVIKKAFDRTLSPFVALGSGYLGKMGNCSVAEIMKLGRQIDSGRNLESELERWSLLYSKMKYCSIGQFESFNDFLKNTAYTDYDNLQFAVICASFPADTTLQFTCPKCNTKFNLTVKNRDLLRTDNVDQNIAEHIHAIIDADTFIERAKEVHEKAMFNQVTRISVEDDNLVLLDMYIPSAYDAIYRTYQELKHPKKDDEDYSSYADLIRMIKCAYIADEDENGELVYDAFEDVNDIFEIISHFTEAQLNRIAQFVQNSYLSKQYYYGIKDVVCTNKECQHHLGEYPMSMDTLLFHKVRPQ